MTERKPRRWLVEGRRLATEPPPRIDFQMHTTWTDGRSSVAAMIAAAKEKRLQAIAITEHINFESTYYADFVAELTALRSAETDIEIYYGIEAAVYDYSGNVKTHLDTKRDAEWCLGVVHSYPKETGGFHSFKQLTQEQALDLEIRGLEALATNPRIDVIGHPGGTYFLRWGGFPVTRMRRAFEIAKRNGIAVELSGRYLWDLPGMLEMLKDVDPLVQIGSDAHEAGEVGIAYDKVSAWFANHSGDA